MSFTERDGDGAVRACVRDFGTGLPADMPERVFDRFFSTNREGMRIGLFIARSIVSRTVARSGRRIRRTVAPSSGCDFRRQRRSVYDARSRACLRH